MTQKQMIYKAAFVELRQQLKVASEAVKDLNDSIASLRKTCEHDWKYDFTCGHKGEDYDICTICGKTR
jgi:hypothetical protein